MLVYSLVKADWRMHSDSIPSPAENKKGELKPVSLNSPGGHRATKIRSYLRLDTAVAVRVTILICLQEILLIGIAITHPRVVILHRVHRMRRVVTASATIVAS